MNDRKNIWFNLMARFGVWLAAVLATYLLASVSATQSVVASLQDMDVEISFATRLAMTGADLVGMAGMLLPMIAFALLLAFLAAALISYWLPRWRWLLYPLAGATAMLTLHLALQLSFQITPVAIARTPGGLLVQGLAGAVGGYLYLRLHRRLAGGLAVEP